MSYHNIQFMIHGWFLIIVLNSLDTDLTLQNVRLDLDLIVNGFKLDEPCIPAEMVDNNIYKQFCRA